jgi:hypothetical protein
LPTFDRILSTRRKKMRQRLTISLLLFFAVFSVAPAAFAADTAVAGQVSGIELCPQFICGSAIFSGLFQGSVDGKPAKGAFSVSVNHGELPDFGDPPSAITGGSWFIRTKRNVLYGNVTTGTITNNGNNTFTVTATLEITNGTGSACFSGVLNHNDFPPTITGTISPSSCP